MKTPLTSVWSGLRAAIFGCSALALGACMPSNYAAQPEDLKARASFDLACPAEQLLVQDLGAETMGVTGCGRRGTYVSSCTGNPGNVFTSCHWLLNNTPAAPAQPAAAAPQALR